jgi:hypothetical protein
MGELSGAAHRHEGHDRPPFQRVVEYSGVDDRALDRGTPAERRHDRQAVIGGSEPLDPFSVIA